MSGIELQYIAHLSSEWGEASVGGFSDKWKKFFLLEFMEQLFSFLWHVGNKLLSVWSIFVVLLAVSSNVEMLQIGFYLPEYGESVKAMPDRVWQITPPHILMFKQMHL